VFLMWLRKNLSANTMNTSGEWNICIRKKLAFNRDLPWQIRIQKHETLALHTVALSSVGPNLHLQAIDLF